jgi:hypothetical protein
VGINVPPALAYAFWIALVTLCSRDYANPPLRFNNR